MKEQEREQHLAGGWHSSFQASVARQPYFCFDFLNLYPFFVCTSSI